MTKLLGAAVAIGLFLIVGAIDFASALELEAVRKDYPLQDAAVPATLRDCRPQDVIAISQNNATGFPWRRYCSGSTAIGAETPRADRKPAGRAGAKARGHHAGSNRESVPRRGNRGLAVD